MRKVLAVALLFCSVFLSSCAKSDQELLSTVNAQATEIADLKAALRAATSNPSPTTVSTSTPKATPTPTAAPVGLNRSLPVPFGQAYAAKNGMAVTVVGIDEDAWPEIEAENMFNDPPRDGNRFVIVRVRVQNLSAGAKSQRVNEADFQAVGSSNRIFKTFQDACGVIPDPLQGDIFEGGQVEGNACFQMPLGERGILAIYAPTMIDWAPVYLATR